MMSNSTVHTNPSTVQHTIPNAAQLSMVQHNTAHSTTKPPLVTIKSNKILLPGDSTNIQVDLPDQRVITESFRANQWPPPQLASIMNQSITLFYNSNQPIYLSEKKATSIKITPISVTEI